MIKRPEGLVLRRSSNHLVGSATMSSYALSHQHSTPKLQATLSLEVKSPPLHGLDIRSFTQIAAHNEVVELQADCILFAREFLSEVQPL
jgi:hypothetical protein